MYTEHVHRSRFQHAIHLRSHFPFRAPSVRTAGAEEGFQSCLDGLKKILLLEGVFSQATRTDWVNGCFQGFWGGSLCLHLLMVKLLNTISALPAQICLSKEMKSLTLNFFSPQG